MVSAEKKRILSHAAALCLALLVLAGCGREIAAAPEESLQPRPMSAVMSAPPAAPEATDAPVEEGEETVGELSARNAGLYNAATFEALYEKQPEERIAPASLTKLVTACTALQYLSGDEIVCVGSEQSLVNPGSSLCWIQPGHRLTLKDLLTGMLMSSGNDAAYAVAVNTARAASGDAGMEDAAAVEYFCGLMNQFAAEIGMANSHFATPDGWDHEEQYTTIRDLAVIGAYAMGVPEIREIVSWPSKYVKFVSGQHITWVNTNAMLNPESPYYSPFVVGMKTGTTTAAGACLVASLEVDGARYIAVVTGCENNDTRFVNMLALIDMVPRYEGWEDWKQLPRER